MAVDLVQGDQGLDQEVFVFLFQRKRKAVNDTTENFKELANTMIEDLKEVCIPVFNPTAIHLTLDKRDKWQFSHLEDNGQILGNMICDLAKVTLNARILDEALNNYLIDRDKARIDPLAEPGAGQPVAAPSLISD